MILLQPKKEHIKDGIYHIPVGTTEIGGGAFVNSEDFTFDIKGIIIPEGVIKIGDSAFFDCFTDIKEIVLPSTINEIGKDAFWALDSVKRVVINSHIKTMGNYAFCNMPNDFEIVFTKEEFFTPKIWPHNWRHDSRVFIQCEQPED